MTAELIRRAWRWERRDHTKLRFTLEMKKVEKFMQRNKINRVLAIFSIIMKENTSEVYAMREEKKKKENGFFQ